MRFFFRAMSGLGIMALALALLAAGAKPYWGCLPGLSGFSCAFDKPERAGSSAAERSFVVRTGVLAPETAQPVLSAFGEIQAARTLELRAAMAGEIVEIGPDFRDGAWVEPGDALFRIDPADSETARLDAMASRLEAEAELAEATEAASLAEAEYQAAAGQRKLREAALERQQGLSQRGFATAADLEAAELALAEAERAVITRAQARATAVRRVAQGELQVKRAELTVEAAGREVSDSLVTAQFAGVLDGIDAPLGRLVSLNESLGTLIDSAALEASFRLSNRDFARVLDQDGRLAPLPVRISLELGARRLTVQGRLDRLGARVDMASGGRRVIARLDPPEDAAAGLLRPGDFVEIQIEEPPLEQVAVTPASALDPEGRLLVLGPEGRLETAVVTVLRRFDGKVALAGAPMGERYVLAPGPQLGPGVKVRTEDDPSERSSETGAVGPQAAQGRADGQADRRAHRVAARKAADAQP